MEEIKRELELATLPEMPKRLDYRSRFYCEKLSFGSLSKSRL